MSPYSEIEMAEALAWQDQWAAAPEGFRSQFQMQVGRVADAALLKMSVPIAHFNMALGVGLHTPLTDENLEAVLQYYAGKAPKGFMILDHPGTQDADAVARFKARGLQVLGYWERIYRDASSYVPQAYAPDVVISEVDATNADAWAKFVIDQYQFTPFLPWLRTYAGRAAWRHYIALQGDQIVAARSFFTAPNGLVWSGIEAPVPGFMTMNFDPDFAIWDRAIADHLAAGAQGFVADIERIDDSRALPSYQQFLGHFQFQLPYRRTQWGFGG